MPVVRGYEALRDLPEEKVAHRHPHVFAPRRDDFLTGETPAYMRRS